MAITYHASWADGLLNAFLRATNPPSGYVLGYYKLGVSGVSIAKNKTIGGASWGAASSGVAALSVPILMTHQNNGTISHLDIQDSGQVRTLLAGLDVTLTAGAAAHAHVDDVNITAAEACNITDFDFHWVEGVGTVKLSTTLRNKLIDMYTGKHTTHISANATVKVYTGTAPASADDVATGTELISFPIDTTSSFTYGAAASSVSTPSAVSANASNTGVVGYARLAWTHNAIDYVIQGSVGTTGTDFILSASSLTATNSYDFTAANTIGF